MEEEKKKRTRVLKRIQAQRTAKKNGNERKREKEKN